MAGFVARWLSDALRLGLALALGLVAMQVPALAHGYAAALLQIAGDARRDIEQRKAAARRFYPGAGDTDEAAIAALRAVEPSNAQALAASVERAGALRAAHDRVQAAPPLLRPVAALLDATEEGRPRGDKGAVLRTALDTHAPQVVLSAAAAIYGLAGLVAGSLLAELVVSASGALASTRRDRGARLARLR